VRGICVFKALARDLAPHHRHDENAYSYVVKIFKKILYSYLKFIKDQPDYCKKYKNISLLFWVE
jgi:hypothetical protein